MAQEIKLSRQEWNENFKLLPIKLLWVENKDSMKWESHTNKKIHLQKPDNKRDRLLRWMSSEENGEFNTTGDKSNHGRNHKWKDHMTIWYGSMWHALRHAESCGLIWGDELSRWMMCSTLWVGSGKNRLPIGGSCWSILRWGLQPEFHKQIALVSTHLFLQTNKTELPRVRSLFQDQTAIH